MAPGICLGCISAGSDIRPVGSASRRSFRKSVSPSDRKAHRACTARAVIETNRWGLGGVALARDGE